MPSTHDEILRSLPGFIEDRASRMNHSALSRAALELRQLALSAPSPEVAGVYDLMSGACAARSVAVVQRLAGDRAAELNERLSAFWVRSAVLAAR